jgi:hypothetical protein
MTENKVVQFKKKAEPFPTFIKMVDGKPVECVDVDSLTPAQRNAFFNRNPNP